MTEREKLEQELDEVDLIIDFLNEALTEQERKRNQVNMALNRARRLEREAHDIKIKRVPDLKGP